MRDLTLVFPNFEKRKIKPSISAKILNLSMLAAIVLMGLTYFYAVNTLGTKGYEIRKLEQQIRAVEEEQKVLQLQASDLQSINKVKDNAQKLNFVPATDVVYLKDADFALK